MDFTKTLALIHESKRLWHKLEFAQRYPLKVSVLLRTFAEEMQNKLERYIIRAHNALLSHPHSNHWTTALSSCLSGLVVLAVPDGNRVTVEDELRAMDAYLSDEDICKSEMPICLEELLSAYINTVLKRRVYGLLGVRNNLTLTEPLRYEIIYHDLNNLTLMFNNEDAMAEFAAQNIFGSISINKNAV